MGSSKAVLTVLKALGGALCALYLALPRVTASAEVPARLPWKRQLQRKLAVLEARHPGQFGVYVKELDSSGPEAELSFRADEYWYIASGVKVPVAVRALQQAEESGVPVERYLDDSKLKLDAEDRLDGAGETNSRRAGELLSLRFLLEQMLIHSDNTASDLLIGKVGLASVNALLRESAGDGFTEVTRLSDVRRLAYSGLHPGATRLTNGDFILLKKAPGEQAKLALLSHRLGVPPSAFRLRGLDAAYAAYYAKRFNSARLSAYGEFLSELAQGEFLSPKGTELLLGILARVETGRHRIRAGLPSSFVFAHKTGTQYKRLCDFGIAWNGKGAGRRVVIAACARGFGSERAAEAGLRFIGQAIHDSGVFDS